MNYSDTRTTRRDAALVSELFDKCLQIDTARRRADYEQAKEWFEKKHHCTWQSWTNEKTHTYPLNAQQR